MSLANAVYSSKERELLLDLAKRAIEYGLVHQDVMPVDLTALPAQFSEHRATFVTLRRFGELRGCCGSIFPSRSLAEDLAASAFAAAFLDSRFRAVSKAEIEDTDISISVLGPPEPIEFTTEEELLAAIVPEADGLLLEDGPFLGTFLPVMWQQLPDKRDFLKHLKRKAGLSFDYWSDTLRVSRYHAEIIK